MSAILSALAKEAVKYGKKEFSSRALKKAANLTTSGLKSNATLSEAKDIVDHKDDSFFTKKNLVKAAATIGLGVATGGSSLLVQFIAMNAMDMGVDHVFNKFDQKKEMLAKSDMNIPKGQLETFDNIDFGSKEVNSNKKTVNKLAVS